MNDKLTTRQGMVSVEMLMIIAIGATILMGLTQFWDSSVKPSSGQLAAAVLGHDEKPNSETFAPEKYLRKQKSSNLIENPTPTKPHDLWIYFGEKFLKSHWYERQALNNAGIVSDFGEAALEAGFAFTEKLLLDRQYKKHKQSDNIFHNKKNEVENTKWTRGDSVFGDVEIILSSEGHLVTNPNLLGTFNFESTPWDHFVKDVVPYLLWGNSADDSTFITDRLLLAEDGLHLKLRDKALSSGSKVKKFNDLLWRLYDQGYLPRQPSIPRDHKF